MYQFFQIFSVLMGCALIAATQFNFTYKFNAQAEQMKLQNLANQEESEKMKPPVVQHTEYKFQLEGNPVPDPVLEPPPPPPKAADVGKVIVKTVLEKSRELKIDCLFYRAEFSRCRIEKCQTG